MAVDVAPEILTAVTREYWDNCLIDEELTKLIDGGLKTQKDLYRYAKRKGEILSEALRACITEDVLPDGILYQNIAKKVLEPTTDMLWNEVIEAGVPLQTDLNKKSGINVKGIKPGKKNRIDGIITRLIQPTPLADAEWLLGSPIVTLAQKVVDDFVYANADNLSNCGYQQTITRTAFGQTCEWCRRLAGKYTYGKDDLPDDFFRRHANCDCTIETEWNGKVENAWTHQTYDKRQRAQLRVDARKYLQQLDAANAEWRKQVRDRQAGKAVTYQTYTAIRKKHGLT